MIFSKAQKESIVSRISFLESELQALSDSSTINWKTYLENKITRRNLERIIENLVNALIDISKIVLSDRASGEIPSSYGDVILKLAELKIIDLDLAAKLAEYIKLRNYLAHQYLDLKWDKIANFIKEAPEKLKLYIEQIKKTI